MKNIALIVAAGRGSRLGSEKPKQYIEILGKPILRYSMEAFVTHPKISGVIVMIQPEDEAEYQICVEGLEKILPPVIGGKTRQESVRRGLQALKEYQPDLVLIHDAARPFVSQRIISEVMQHVPAVPVLPVIDTIRTVEKTLERRQLHRVQTPQCFDFRQILNAHQTMIAKEFSDDASLAEAYGLRIHMVEGEENNMKITNPEDIRAFQRMETRVGNGIDVHGFKEGDSITLCGVHIPFHASLDGHSDADVGLHAIVDALLGAMAKDDIGAHFSPKDERWKGADSKQFVKYAFELLQQMGGKINHIDLTFIGEEPKISPHRQAMREVVADLLETSLERISIKATTTEKLGFLGRKEGLAAMANVTIEVPTHA